jgi:hypothetical protein
MITLPSASDLWQGFCPSCMTKTGRKYICHPDQFASYILAVGMCRGISHFQHKRYVRMAYSHARRPIYYGKLPRQRFTGKLEPEAGPWGWILRWHLRRAPDYLNVRCIRKPFNVLSNRRRTSLTASCVYQPSRTSLRLYVRSTERFAPGRQDFI